MILGARHGDVEQAVALLALRAASAPRGGRAGTGRPSPRAVAGLRQRAPRPDGGEKATTGASVSTPLCMAATNTTGNSSPLAECTVITFTASAESSGGASGSRGLASRTSASSRRTRRATCAPRRRAPAPGTCRCSPRARRSAVAAIVDGGQQQAVEGDILAALAPFVQTRGEARRAARDRRRRKPAGLRRSASAAPSVSPMILRRSSASSDAPTSGERSTAARLISSRGLAITRSRWPGR